MTRKLTHITILALSALVYLIGCKKEEPVQIDNPITLSLDKSTLDADGKSLIMVTVEINEDFTDDFREVTLTVTDNGGKFKAATGDGKTYSKTVNSAGKLTTDFVVGLIPGDYTITASIGANNDYQDDKSFTLVPLVASDLITIEAADTTGKIPNGVDYFMLTVDVPDFPNKAFELYVSEGSMQGEADGKLTGTLDGSGHSEVKVTTALFKTNYYFTFKLTEEPQLISYKEVKLKTIGPSDVIWINPPINNVSADGIQQFTFTVEAPAHGSKQVSIGLTNGTLVNPAPDTNVILNSNGTYDVTVRTAFNVTSYPVTAKLVEAGVSANALISATGVNTQNIISIQQTNTGDPDANGIDEIVLQVSATDYPNRQVKLIPGAGSIVSPNTTDSMFNLDGSGNRTVRLKTVPFVTNYPVTVELTDINVSANMVASANAINPANVLQLSLTDTAGDLADNFSTFKVVADVNDINWTGQTVTFNVTNGTLIGQGSVPVYNGQAQATIRTTANPQDVIITASMSAPVNVSSTILFSPGIAYPDVFQVVSNASAVDSANFNLGVTLLFGRNQGSVSNNRIVSATTTQAPNGTPIGMLSPMPITNGTNQQVELTFSGSSSGSVEPITLEFTTETTGGAVTRSITVTVNTP